MSEASYVFGSQRYLGNAQDWRITAQVRQKHPLNSGVGLKPIGWIKPPDADNDKKFMQ